MSALPIQDGLIWSDQIISPEEGPYTIACKLATLNSDRVLRLLTRVFGPSLSQRLARHSTRSMNRPNHWEESSLTARWTEIIERHTDVTEVGREILVRTLASQLGGFATAISISQHFRYCPECLRVGFQSTLHQIAAIVRCPIHRCELLTTCRRCGGPTPSYGIVSAFKYKMQCPRCSVPLATAWERDCHVVCWARPPGHEALSLLKCLLYPIKRLVIERHDGFDTHFGRLPDACKMIAHFAVAYAVTRPAIPLDILDTRALSAQPLVVQAKPADLEVNGFINRPRHELHSAYLALNEMLQESIGEDRLERFQYLSGGRRFRGVHGDLVYVNDPEALALSLWRFRSDQCPGKFSTETTRIRSSYVVNITFQNLSIIDWLKLLIVTFEAELRLAKAWCQLLASVKDDPEGTIRLSEFFSAFFQLSRDPSPPAVTKVIVFHGPRQERHEECTLAIWDASTVFPIEPLVHIGGSTD